jgi:hypothetical protein
MDDRSKCRFGFSDFLGKLAFASLRAEPAPHSEVAEFERDSTSDA